MKKKLLAVVFFLQVLFVSGQTSSPVYLDDFENGAPGWTTSSISGSVWHLDTSSAAGTGNHVWGIGLDTNYQANTEAFLYTPIFSVPFPAGLNLCFWQIFNTAIYEDGMRVEWSVDGITWYTFGSVGTGVNWYNTYFITSSGNLPGWSGSSPFWQQASIALDNTMASAILQFRFVFTSNLSGNLNGYLIDNFCFDDTIICNCSNPLGVSEPIFNNESFTIYPNPVKDQITINLNKNYTYKNIEMFDIVGNKILNKNISENKSVLDVKNISDGIYFISVEGDVNKVRKKIIVLH